MPGGLLQLASIGSADAILVGKPEITCFKNVYRKHTLFSVVQNMRYISNTLLNKNSFSSPGNKRIEKNGDLLSNQYFKLEIPYFEIIKTVTNQTITKSPYNINQLQVNYINSNCIILYNNNNWYIVPEELFKISHFSNIITNIDSNLLVPSLLPDYITITDIGQYAKLYYINDNSVSSVISLLIINSSYWEQFWLNFMSNASNNQNVDLLNKLITVQSQFNLLYNNFKYNIYNNYVNLNLIVRNKQYFDFNFLTNDSYKTEVERYFEYTNLYSITTSNILQNYDMDLTYNYCINNSLTFDSYKDTILSYNSKVILLILNMLYSDPSNIFTFWVKYNTDANNEPLTTTPITSNFNLKTEWENNLNNYLQNIFNLNSLNNFILETFHNVYSRTEQFIINLFNNLKLNSIESIYVQLKVILDRFITIPNGQLNFSNFYLATLYVSTTDRKSVV